MRGDKALLIVARALAVAAGFGGIRMSRAYAAFGSGDFGAGAKGAAHSAAALLGLPRSWAEATFAMFDRPVADRARRKALMRRLRKDPASVDVFLRAIALCEDGPADAAAEG
jgi:hypothetical protein